MVPRTWWRAGFSSDLLLLSHNDSELPRKLFDSSRAGNKKLRNIYQCVTRQQFIRKTVDLNAPKDNLMYVLVYMYFICSTFIYVCMRYSGGSSGRCSSMDEAVVQSFLGLWGRSAHLLGGQIDQVGGTGVWWPEKVEGSKLVLSALEVLKFSEVFLFSMSHMYFVCLHIPYTYVCMFLPGA